MRGFFQIAIAVTGLAILAFNPQLLRGAIHIVEVPFNAWKADPSAVNSNKFILPAPNLPSRKGELPARETINRDYNPDQPQGSKGSFGGGAVAVQSAGGL
jgi:hypothetical protein